MRPVAMTDRCESCDARLNPDATWCLQCFAPVREPARAAAAGTTGATPGAYEPLSASGPEPVRGAPPAVTPGDAYTPLAATRPALTLGSAPSGTPEQAYTPLPATGPAASLGAAPALTPEEAYTPLAATEPATGPAVSGVTRFNPTPTYVPIPATGVPPSPDVAVAPAVPALDAVEPLLARPRWSPPSSLETLDPIPAVPLRPKREGLVTLTIAVILLNVVFQIATLVAARSGAIEPGTAIRWSLWLTCGFYGLVLFIAVGKGRNVAFQPVWTEGDPVEAAAIGAATGAGVAVGLMLLGRLVTGHIVVDSRVALIVSEHTITRILAVIVIVVIAAPVVEELLFRGLVVESMRHKPMRQATGVAALLFALWHLNLTFAALAYYYGLGMLLGRLYWRRGLQSSIAAHAAFNGCIVIAALALSTGPSHIISAGGVSVRAPADWHLHIGADTGPAVLAADGPSGSGIVVTRSDIPAGRPTPDVQQVADRINEVAAAVPGAELNRTSVRVVDEPFGQAVRMTIKVKGHSGEVVIAVKPGTVWTVVLVSSGSGRAQHDFEGILQHLQLP